MFRLNKKPSSGYLERI